MASELSEPSYVELWGGSKITKPEPLRIIKRRSETIAGCITPRKSTLTERRSSKPAPTAGGSPPEGPNVPLTIRKRRRNKRSLLDGSFGYSSDGSFGLPMPEQAADQGDNLATPKAQKLSARTESVGSFLKSELLRGSSETELETATHQQIRPSTTRYHDPTNPLDANLFPPFNLDERRIGVSNASVTTQKRSSKGRKLILRAFDSFGTARSRSIQILHSRSLKESSLRHPSLRNRQKPLSTSSEEAYLDYSRFSFEPLSTNTTDASANSSILSDRTLDRTRPSYILYPEITIIPEVSLVDIATEVSFWVAVTITGALRATNYSLDRDSDQRSSGSHATSISDRVDFGHLYDVHIDIIPRSSCVLEDVIVNLRESRTLQAGEIVLIIAKVKFETALRSSSRVKESSAELLAELECQLGETITNYLDVRVTFKHSALPTYRGSAAAPMGMSYYATSINTEAHAVIKRYSSISGWNYGRYDSLNTDKELNPIIPLIRMHYEPKKAQKLIDRIAEGSKPLDGIRRRQIFLDRNWSSSSDTIVPTRNRYIRIPTSHTDTLENNAQPLSVSNSRDSPLVSSDNPDHPLVPTGRDKVDPARRIWNELRKNSRSNSNYRLTPSTTTTSENPGGYSDRKAAKEPRQLMELTKEQTRIMELALRNKRSLGADTLRSMAAPSTQLGLGSGRGWVWGSPWW